mgnify:CR=1 FL=1
METNTMKRTMALAIAGAGMLMLAATGCKSTQSLSQTEMQARLATLTEAVRLEQVRSGSPVVADFLGNVPKSGAAGYTQVQRVVRNPDGTPLILSDGKPAMEGGVAVGLLNSMRDFGNVDQAWLVLGGWARNPLTGEVSRDATLDGVFTYVTGGGVASTVNREFAAVWAEVPATEKAAAAEAVRKALEVRKGMIVEGIAATGEAVRGILKEVYRATPAGAGLAAVEVLLESGGKEVPATVTEPFRTLPSTSGDGGGK